MINKGMPWWIAVCCVFSGCNCGGVTPPPRGDAATPVDAATPDATQLGPCTTNRDCVADTYCDPDTGRCAPYGVPPMPDRDPACAAMRAPGVFSPTVQCAFDRAPAGDPFPNHLHVLSTPMVADFRIGRASGAPARPSIVAVFNEPVGGGVIPQATGVIRILDGQTCQQQAELGSLQRVADGAPVAIGDLTDDGRPEIVAFKADGGLVAFTYRESAWSILWQATRPDGSPYTSSIVAGWSGPTLYDLNDDRFPEILRNGSVFDARGRLMQEFDGFSPDSRGEFPVVANVDEDPAVEFVTASGVWQWAGAQWLRETWSRATPRPGTNAAIADFGAYPGGDPMHPWPASAPEVVVIRSLARMGTVEVQTLDGRTVFGPFPLDGVGDSANGSAGPPTIADFDGDGRAEFATASSASYTVFDLDCIAGGGTGMCASNRTDGVLWRQASQDQTSGFTGSSVFDFDGDGRAEAVYADECFVRVYDGRTGTVLFSQAHSSATFAENPVIADVDGDFNAEIVVGSNFNGSGDPSRAIACPGLGPMATDPLHPGLRCVSNAECLSGNCVMGFCRCTTNTQCCEGLGCDRAALVCAPPPSGTPGEGSTCRASRPQGTYGIRVLRDGADRWVRSRMIWNQHVYFVTNVNDDGTIPSASAARRNWLESSLNNFRQNVQGNAVPSAAPDVTTSGGSVQCAPGASGAFLRARVCNRGTEPIQADLAVDFLEGVSTSGPRICQGRTVSALAPGECEDVGCIWPRPTDAGITVVVDTENTATECREDNNRARFASTVCVDVR